MDGTGDKVTMSRVAEEAGVSKATVSRALGGSMLIGEEVRTQVAAVADRLGYVRRSQRRHAERSILTVKLVLPDSGSASTQLFYSFKDLVDGLREGLQPSCVNVIVDTYGRDFEPFPHKKGGEIDAFVFAFHRPSSEVIRVIEGRGAACVVLNRTVRGIRHVVSDHQDAFRKIARHLGDRGVSGKCCFVSYQGIGDVVKARLQGFREGCEGAGIDFDAERDCWEAGAPNEISRDGVKKLYQRGVRTFVGVNDVAGMVLLQHVRELSLAVPAEVRVTGCDCGPLYEITHPRLTTVDLSILKLAREVGRSLQDEIVQKKKTGKTLMVSGDLIVGETT